MTELCFLGHRTTEQGIQPNPEKTAATAKMPPSTRNLKGLRRLMGIIKHLGKVSDLLTELTQPLHELLSKSNSRT